MKSTIRSNIHIYWKYFLVTLIPIHIWAIINGFYSINETSAGISISEEAARFSYILLFAFLESLIFSTIIVCILFLIEPAEWGLERKLVINSQISWLIQIGKMIILLFAQITKSSPKILRWFDTLITRNHDLALVIITTLFWAIVLTIVLVTLHRNRFTKTTASIIERIIPLAYLYLGLDAFAILFLVFRNFY